MRTFRDIALDEVKLKAKTLEKFEVLGKEVMKHLDKGYSYEVDKQLGLKIFSPGKILVSTPLSMDSAKDIAKDVKAQYKKNSKKGVVDLGNIAWDKQKSKDGYWTGD